MYAYIHKDDVCILMILTKNRWKNATTNSYSMPDAKVDSDHFPIIARSRIKFAQPKTQSVQKQHKYDIKQDDHDVEEFNKAIKEALGVSTCTLGSLQEGMRDAAHACLKQPAPQTKKPWIKPTTLEMIHQKHEIMKAGSAEEKKHICKQVKN